MSPKSTTTTYAYARERVSSPPRFSWERVRKTAHLRSHLEPPGANEAPFDLGEAIGDQPTHRGLGLIFDEGHDLTPIGVEIGLLNSDERALRLEVLGCG